MNFRGLLRGRRHTWLRIFSDHLTLRGRNEPNGAFGIIPPAIRVGIFLTAVVQATYLVFQSGAIVLINDRRGNENEQVTFSSRIEPFLKKIADYWNIPQDRDLVASFGNFILE